MIKKIFIVCVLFTGCFNNIFYFDIPELLGLKGESLEYKNIYSIESVAGPTGEGTILEIYLLSENIITVLSKNGIKKLPNKEGYNKIDWKKGKCAFGKEIEGFINYCGNKNLEKKLIEIRELLLQNNIYTALYYRGNTIECSFGIQLMLLDLANKELYIYEIDV